MTENAMEALALRLRAVEDRLAILDLLAGAAMSADVPSEPYWRAMYAPEAVLDRGPGQIDAGREQLLAILASPGQHAAAEHGMAHIAATPRIVIDGDRAIATGYLLVVVPGAGMTKVALPGKGVSQDLAIYHLTVNQWELERTAQGWQVIRRILRPIATDAGRELLRTGIEQASAAELSQ
jgi:SnoaL-like domain